ncbi:hypothetical protein JCM10449v2_000743 [Rhodotorula kratochvilovae]
MPPSRRLHSSAALKVESVDSTSQPSWPALDASLPLSPPSSASSSTSECGRCVDAVDKELKPPRVGKANLVASSADAPRPAKVRISAARKAGNPPRPANAWICYRSARVHELKASSEYAKLPQADISKIIGQLWRDETPEIRRHYELEAERKKAEHKEKYPDYIFRPVRREAVKQTRKKRAAPAPTAPPPQPLGTDPSVLQPVPTDAVPSFLKSEPLALPALPDLPNAPHFAPHFQPDDLPVPQPFIANAEPIPCDSNLAASSWTMYDGPSSLHFLPSPPWSAADLAPTTCVPEYTLPNSLHLDALDPYLSPPASATIANFDDLWQQAVASTDHVELPYPY